MGDDIGSKGSGALVHPKQYTYINCIVISQALLVGKTTMRILSGLLTSILVAEAELQYGDRFNYDKTVTRADGFTDYGPEDWIEISCDESSREGLDACIAYIDKWHEGQGWSIKENACQSCPADDPGSCGRHHNSPINMLRNKGLGYWNKTEENNGNPGANADPDARECIDQHWMKYEVRRCQALVH